MTSLNFVYFLQIHRIKKSSSIFEKLDQKQNCYYSYFQVNKIYYLLVYGKNKEPQAIDFLFDDVQVIKSLNKKTRKIRSLHGYFLYALEIFKSSTDVRVIRTNLNALFWEQAADILRQNKKGGLDKFLWGSSHLSTENEIRDDKVLQKIQNLEEELLILRQRLQELEKNLPKPPSSAPRD